MRARVASVLAFGLTTSGAWAQDADPATRATAVNLFDTAQALISEGKTGEACPKFAESYRLDPQLGVLLHLGICLENDGKLASAYAAFRDAIEVAERKGDERAALAKERSQALEPRLSRLTVEVPGDHQLPSLEVLRDGVTLAKGSWNTPIAIDAGKHEIVARAPGHEPWSTAVEISGEGQSERVVIPTLSVLPEATPETSTSAGPPPTDDLELRDPGATQRTIGFAVGGLGVVGLGAGVFFLIQKGNKIDESDSICPSGTCPAGTAAESQERIDALIEDARSAQTLSTISFIAGGALLAGGVTLILTAPKAGLERKQASFSLVPVFDSRSAGLWAQHTF